ncbi:ANTAR domain-containing protein [Streptomyces sp. NPDC048385]|uniref:ANTAR domain-containing protein n=1 Tax=unclassified Streptomyces TaxID=2593676 RepID=UPI003419F662
MGRTTGEWRRRVVVLNPRDVTHHLRPSSGACSCDTVWPTDVRRWATRRTVVLVPPGGIRLAGESSLLDNASTQEVITVNPPVKTGRRLLVEGLQECPNDAAELIAGLREEVTQLQQAIISHAVIDQAIGVVITVGGLGPEQGCEVLKEVSQVTNTKLRQVAEQLVDAVRSGRLAEETRHALGAALERAKPG